MHSLRQGLARRSDGDQENAGEQRAGCGWGVRGDGAVYLSRELRDHPGFPRAAGHRRVRGGSARHPQDPCRQRRAGKLLGLNAVQNLARIPSGFVSFP